MVRTVIPFRSAPRDVEADAFVADRLKEEAGETGVTPADHGQVAEVWDALGQLDSADFEPGAARAEAGAQMNRRAWMIGGTLAAGVAIGGVFLWRQQPVIHETGVGERRTIRLSDGTEATLNTDSRIIARVNGDRREVVVEQGEVFFDVAHLDGAAFNVFSHEARIHVTGTRFNVRRHSSFTDVDLLEGSVDIGARSAVDAKGLSLAAGQAIRIDIHGQPTAPLSPARAAYIEDWRQGRISFDHTRLSEAVAEMNRYSQTPLVLDDQELGNLLIDGVFEAGDTAAFARALRDLRGVHIRREGPYWRLSSGTA
jgi:transmembrane sensor